MFSNLELLEGTIFAMLSVLHIILRFALLTSVKSLPIICCKEKKNNNKEITVQSNDKKYK